MDIFNPEVISAVCFIGSIATVYAALEKRLTKLEVSQEHITKTLDEIKEELRCR